MKNTRFPTTLDSMKAELHQWSSHNNWDYEFSDWLAAKGNFDLAAGYIALFCPNIIEFEECLLIADEINEADAKELRKQKDKKALERGWNHFHLWDFHPALSERGLTPEKAVFIGQRLQHIYTARLMALFPDYPCRVEFYQPADPDNIADYQLTFWQIIHESSPYTEAEKALIDGMLIKCCQKHWLKSARVLFEAQFSLEKEYSSIFSNYSDVETSVFFIQRLMVLLAQGKLQAQGNLRRPRFSEVKLP